MVFAVLYSIQIDTNARGKTNDLYQVCQVDKRLTASRRIVPCGLIELRYGKVEASST